MCSPIWPSGNHANSCLPLGPTLSSPHHPTVYHLGHRVHVRSAWVLTCYSLPGPGHFVSGNQTASQPHHTNTSRQLPWPCQRDKLLEVRKPIIPKGMQKEVTFILLGNEHNTWQGVAVNPLGPSFITKEPELTICYLRLLVLSFSFSAHQPILLFLFHPLTFAV